ncbi:MAG: hypothetical protein AAF518_09835 [Spirochaetota bacterium]
MSQDFLTVVKKDYSQFGSNAKSFLNHYSKLSELAVQVLNWIPIEFFILLPLSVLLLLMLNSVSQKTRKVNLIFSLLIVAGVMMLLNQVIIDRYKAIATGKAALYIIIPVYAYYLFGSFFGFIVRYFRKRRLGKAGNIERSIFNLQMAYNESMAQAHLLLSDGDYDAAKLKEKLNYLKIASDGLSASLDKQQKP